MATEASKPEVPKAAAAVAAAAATGEKKDEVVSVELPAPIGWIKKYTPRKSGTPRRSEIVFTSPTGEEIKNKRQLEQFLKANPGGPASSEFDWGTGDTPRRSARIVGKSKATETPENEPPKKRERKSSSKKKAKDEDSSAEKGKESKEEEDPAVAEPKSKKSLDAQMEEVEDAKVKGSEEIVEGEVAKEEEPTAADAEEAKDSMDTKMEEAAKEEEATAAEAKASLDTKMEEAAKEEEATAAEAKASLDKKIEEVAEVEETAAADAEESKGTKVEEAAKEEATAADPEASLDTKVEEVPKEEATAAVPDEAIAASLETKMEVDEKSLEEVAPGEALVGQEAVLDSHKTEETYLENENVEADNNSETKEVQVENNLVPDTTDGPVDTSLVPDAIDGQVENNLPPLGIDGQVETSLPAVVEENKVSEAPTPLAASEVAVAEKEVEGAEENESVEASQVGEEAVPNNDAQVGQGLADNSGFKDGQETNAKGFEEAHQPKSSPVNC